VEERAGGGVGLETPDLGVDLAHKVKALFRGQDPRDVYTTTARLDVTDQGRDVAIALVQRRVEAAGRVDHGHGKLGGIVLDARPQVRPRL